ncbi:heme A synthase [Promicromonospora thailandica]|uniref:Cytochrome c oxidase assembly protein subunit 15 n=1 Tax=Promicromonospora thailandica TaxID=765201 RepID=A0A9X2GC89_9MICO|nr:COX15/CtaA family protein [Promicromonospora thailandica]MCP2267144.1 cytochrome c oxidase assembly protein subunit 15 [Promicromonospora thailandica]BFF17553.1 COX15/CtaA family protein [Promicromonospora thailandica]
MTATAAPASWSTALAGRVDRFRSWTRAVLVANLIGQIGIIGTGGAVRLTDSGLGCSTWPQCEPGSFTPQFHAATTLHPYIEFGNRTLTGVLGLIGVLLAVLVWTDLQRSLSYRVLGFVPIVAVLAQAVIGGVVVLLDLHPGWVSLHFGVSAALVAASLYILHRHDEGDGAPVRVVGPRTRTLAWLLAGLTAVVVVLGVLTTGAGPHSGDSEVGYRFAVDPALLTKWHAAAVWAFLAALVTFLVTTRRAPAPVRRATLLLLVITLAQGLIGYVQYFTDLPELLVGLHMVGAAALIAGTTRVWLTTRERA